MPQHKGLKYILGASISPELVAKIDAVRGQVPRSRIVENALNQYLISMGVKGNVTTAALPVYTTTKEEKETR